MHGRNGNKKPQRIEIPPQHILQQPPQQPTPEQIAQIPSFEFDGRRFIKSPTDLWLLYIAKKARDGDPDAIALLNNCDQGVFEFCDADTGISPPHNLNNRRRYWPVPQEQPKVNVEFVEGQVIGDMPTGE